MSLIRGIHSRHAPLAAACLLLASAAGCGAAPADLAITDITVIDPATGEVTEDQTVVVAGGVIRSVAATTPGEAPAAEVVIDGAGRFLIPGLWDAHTHLDMHTDTDLAMLVVHGVLNVRDMGGDPFLLADLKTRIASGELVGPTILGAGSILEDRRWLTEARKIVSDLLEHRVPVDNPEEARATVAMLKSWGADLIKVRNVTDRQTLAAILAAAKAEGLTVAGHEPLIVDLDEAASLGMTTFEHIPFLTFTMPGKEVGDERLTAAIESIRAAGAYICPTLIASNDLVKPREEMLAAMAEPDERYQFLPDSVRETWVEMLEYDAGPLPWAEMRDRSIEIARRMHRAGIPFLAGTDLGVPLTFPGFALHDELELLVEQMGLSPMEALQAATSAPASLLGVKEGSIAPGMAANMVLLEFDPLESIENTRSIDAVIVRGELFDRARLDGLLDHVRENKDAPPDSSVFERAEASCRAGESPECLEKLAGYLYSKSHYAEARTVFQEALDAGSDDGAALEGLFASTINLLHEESVDCADAAAPVSGLLAAHPDDAAKAVGVLDRVLSAIGTGCEDARAAHLRTLAKIDPAAVSDEMQPTYHEHYASFLFNVEGDGDAAYEYRLAHMRAGWEENALEIRQLAGWCLNNEVALPQARELAQRAAQVSAVSIGRLESTMLEARIASAMGDHHDAVALMEEIDRAVPNNATVIELLESFRKLAAEAAR